MSNAERRREIAQAVTIEIAKTLDLLYKARFIKDATPLIDAALAKWGEEERGKRCLSCGHKELNHGSHGRCEYQGEYEARKNCLGVRCHCEKYLAAIECTCHELRKQNDYRACPFCQKNCKSDCLCNGVGCVKCCGPS